MYPKTPDYSFEEYWAHRDDYVIAYAGSSCHSLGIDGEQLFYDVYALYIDEHGKYNTNGFRLYLRP